jgi:hypothetical protein
MPSGLVALAFASPHYSFFAGSASRYAANPTAFWWSLGLAHLEGWALLFSAAWFVARAWRGSSRAHDAPLPSYSASSRRKRWQATTFSPINYAANQSQGQSAILWVAILIKSLTWLLTALVFSWVTVNRAYAVTQGAGLITSIGSSALLAWAAARFFLDARRSGELELLMSTPVGAQEIVSGQWASLWRRLRWPFGFLVFTNLISPAMYIFQWRSFPGSYPFGFFLLQNLFSIANSALSILATCWLGIWFGLRGRNTFSAVMRTVVLGLGIPWLVSMLANAVARWTIESISSPTGSWSYFILHIMVSGILMAMNIGFVVWAKRKLRRELRLQS